MICFYQKPKYIKTLINFCLWTICLYQKEQCTKTLIKFYERYASIKIQNI